jgi:hypothetical protein
MKWYERIILISILMTGILVPTRTGLSQGLTFSISPENPEVSYFDFTLNPGESVSDAIIAKNFSGEKLFLTVERVFAKSGTNGGLSYDFENTGSYEKWISMEKGPDIEVIRYGTQRIPFTITVPEGTPAGEYVIGFLSAQQAVTPTPLPSQGVTPEGYVVDVITRVAVAIIIRVPGDEKCQLEMKEFDATVYGAQWRYSMLVHNSGNTHFYGTASIVIKEKETGKIFDQKQVKIGYFSPDTDMPSENYFDIPKPGKYEYSIVFSDKDRPGCKFAFTGETEYGKPEQNLLSTQSTIIAIFNQTDTPTVPGAMEKTKTTGVINQINTPGSTPWFVWISAVIFLISLGLVIYALTILKKSKKS